MGGVDGVRSATLPCPPVPVGAEVHHVACADLPIADGAAALVLTDPPWHADRQDCWDALASAAFRWLAPGGHLVSYCGQVSLPMALATLSGVGLTYRWTMCMWRAQQAPVHGRRMLTRWRPVVVFRQPGGPALDARPMYDWCDAWTAEQYGAEFSVRAEKGGHPWQQPEYESRYLIERLTDPGDLVVDPFSGSGTVGAAALTLGRRCIVGDVDEEAIEATRWRLASVERRT